MTSVKMIILYFCTMVPVMFVLIVISRLVFGISEGILDNGESVARFIMLFFAVIADTVVWLVSTAAFVWAMKDFLPKMAGGK